MSDIRFNRWLHQSGTGGVYQDGSGRVGIGSSVPSEALTVVGNINATSGTFSGNVSIGGTLTYEDVTNIDSVGVITARSGIHVTSGSIGIGTDNPATKLQIVGSTNSAESTGGTLGIRQKGDSVNDGITLTSSHANSARIYKDSDSTLHIFNTGGSSDDFVITNAGLVGIGTDNPLRKLSVNGVIESLGQVSAGSTDEGGHLMLRAPSQQLSGTKYRYSMDVNYGHGVFARPVGSEVSGIRFLREDDSTGANGQTLASIGQDGIMSLPYLPCFRARHSNNTLGTGTLVYTQVDTNIGSHYDNTNGRFTAPITGFYSFKAHTLIQNATGGEVRMALYKNDSGSGLGSRYIIRKGSNQWETIHVNGDFYLNAGDYVTVRMEQNPTTTYSDSNYNAFSGFLVG